MTKLLLVGIVGLSFSLTSCATKNLYTWSDYEKRSYAYIKESSEENLEDLIKSYETMLIKQTGKRKTPPPGIFADYGYLLIKKGMIGEGIIMLKKEMALYPESSTFLSRIIKKLEE